MRLSPASSVRAKFSVTAETTPGRLRQARVFRDLMRI